VPKTYTGILSLNNAYELKPQFNDWQGHDTFVSIYKFNKKENEIEKLKKSLSIMKRKSLVNNLIILIKDNYVYEYRSQKKGKKFVKLPLLQIEASKLGSYSLKTSPFISFKEGVNFKEF